MRGDILKAISFDYMTNQFVGEVVFHEGSYQIKRKAEYDSSEFWYHRIGHIGSWQDMGASGTISYAYEVIGNIHDNPELLGGGE